MSKPDGSFALYARLDPDAGFPIYVSRDGYRLLDAHVFADAADSERRIQRAFVLNSLDEVGSVAGRIQDDQGEPVRNVVCVFTPTEGDGEWMTESDSEGEFYLRGLPPGLTNAFFHAPDERRLRREVEVQVGHEVRVTVTLPSRRRSELRIRLIDADRRPIDNVAVRLGSSFSSRRYGTTNERGELRIQRLGDERFLAFDHAQYPRQIMVVPRSSSEETLVWTLRRGSGRVSGRVLDSLGRAASRARIRLASEQRGDAGGLQIEQLATTNDRGEFSMTGLPNRDGYVLWITHRQATHRQDVRAGASLEVRLEDS